MTRYVYPLVSGVTAAGVTFLLCFHYWPWLSEPKNGLTLLLSVWTLSSMAVAGWRPRVGWGLALAGQIPWAAYTYYADAWGFLPLNIGLTGVYAWNLWRAPRGNPLWPLVRDAYHSNESAQFLVHPESMAYAQMRTTARLLDAAVTKHSDER